jgi:chitinase
MRKSFHSFLAIAFWLAAGPVVHADWPARVFAPYMYIGAGDNFKLTNCANACGLKFYTLAFIIARQEGRGTNTIYHKEASWDGRIPMEQNLYHDQIDAIRKGGGDVIMSFGGEAGKELANEIDDPAQLEAAYQKVIDQYKFTWLDFDVEGDNLDKGKMDSERRNTVLASLQKKNPGLIISYTLPVDPSGISEASQTLLADAKAKGVKVHSANLMVMFFGKEFTGKGKSEGQLGIDSANKAYEQLQKIDPAIQIGLCPCLGRNGSKDEIFTEDDAKTLKAWADTQKWVCSLSFWAINRDAGNKPSHRSENTNSEIVQKPWAFTDIFKTFTTQ